MARKPAQSGPGSSELSGKRYAGLLEDALSEWDTMKTHMMEATHSDGYPPFTSPADPQREFEALSRMREQGDPKFWGSPAALKQYQALEHRYGNPAAPTADSAAGGAMVTPGVNPTPPIPTVPDMNPAGGGPVPTSGLLG